MSSVFLAEWTGLLAETDYSQRLIRQNQLFDALTQPDITSLLAIYSQSHNKAARYLAAAFLLSLIRNNDERLCPDCRRVAGETARMIVEADYPKTELSARSFALLELTDPDVAENLILAVNPNGLSGNALLHYMSGLQYRSTPLKNARLQQLRFADGELGKWATKALGNAGKLSEAEVLELAEEFRANHSTVLLNKIFHVYVRFVTGSPLKGVRELLGPPSLEERQCLLYQTEEPFAQVKIYFNAEGMVTDVWHR